jgi:hypothetical protein
VEDTRPGHWGFMVMWEFVVNPGMEARFEEVYGASGKWVCLFERDANFLCTELNHECEGRYLTLDIGCPRKPMKDFEKNILPSMKPLIAIAKP